MTPDDLNQLEALRRKALWMLADLPFGDPRAVDALDILDEVERQGAVPTSPFDTELSIEQVFELVPSAKSRTGIAIVRDEDIPRPWRQRFLCASRGSTRLVEGAYLKDWEKFVGEWKEEMHCVRMHRHARKA